MRESRNNRVPEPVGIKTELKIWKKQTYAETKMFLKTMLEQESREIRARERPLEGRPSHIQIP